MDQVDQQLDKLNKIAQELNRESNDLNSVIEDLETRLSNMQIGVSVFLEKPIVEIGRSKVYLGYYKLVDRNHNSSEWCFVTAQGNPTDPQSHKLKLTKTSRAVRLAAVKKLGELVEAICMKAQRYVDDLHSANEEVGKLLPDLREFKW